jgi:hypothetical protein
MPYFVYKVIEKPIKHLEPIERFDRFRDASVFAKARRAELAAESGVLVKMVFAENALEAEDTLMQEREKEPITGDDW